MRPAVNLRLKQPMRYARSAAGPGCRQRIEGYKQHVERFIDKDSRVVGADWLEIAPVVTDGRELLQPFRVGKLIRERYKL